MNLLWNELTQYKMLDISSSGYFSSGNEITVLSDSKEEFLLIPAKSPKYVTLKGNTAKFPVKVDEVSFTSFFLSLPTYMEQIKKIGDIGVTETSEVDVDTQVAPIKWKMYDYDRNTYRDYFERARFSVFSFFPSEPNQFTIIESGHGVHVDNLFLLGSTISVNYNSDLYHAVHTNYYGENYLLIKKEYLQALL